MVDLIHGGTIEYPDGHTITLPPNSQRVFGSIWHNGGFIEVLFYEQPQPRQNVSDRIHLLITPAKGKRRGWLMNVEDAIAIIRGLSVAITQALEQDIPVKPPD